MKKIYLLFLLLITQNLKAQESTPATNQFKITGRVKVEKNFTLAELQRYPTVELNDVNISCSPKKEDREKKVKVVLLKQLLDSVTFQYERPKELNEFYFLFVASDGYKLVFSFNEIYNTETGNNLFITTEIEGKKVSEMNNRILLLTTKDIKSGSRNMKWLSEIIVKKAE